MHLLLLLFTLIWFHLKSLWINPNEWTKKMIAFNEDFNELYWMFCAVMEFFIWVRVDCKWICIETQEIISQFAIILMHTKKGATRRDLFLPSAHNVLFKLFLIQLSISGLLLATRLFLVWHKFFLLHVLFSCMKAPQIESFIVLTSSSPIHTCIYS